MSRELDARELRKFLELFAGFRMIESPIGPLHEVGWNECVKFIRNRLEVQIAAVELDAQSGTQDVASPQQDSQDELRAALATAADALSSVEWVDSEYDGTNYSICPWCHAQLGMPDEGHRKGCERQEAIAKADAVLAPPPEGSK